MRAGPRQRIGGLQATARNQAPALQLKEKWKRDDIRKEMYVSAACAVGMVVVFLIPGEIFSRGIDSAKWRPMIAMSAGDAEKAATGEGALVAAW